MGRFKCGPDLRGSERGRDNGMRGIPERDDARVGGRFRRLDQDGVRRLSPFVLNEARDLNVRAFQRLVRRSGSGPAGQPQTAAPPETAAPGRWAGPRTITCSRTVFMAAMNGGAFPGSCRDVRPSGRVEGKRIDAFDGLLRPGPTLMVHTGTRSDSSIRWMYRRRSRANRSGPAPRDVLFPAGQFLVHGLDLLKRVDARREIGGQAPRTL